MVSVLLIEPPLEILLQSGGQYLILEMEAPAKNGGEHLPDAVIVVRDQIETDPAEIVTGKGPETEREKEKGMDDMDTTGMGVEMLEIGIHIRGVVIVDIKVHRTIPGTQKGKAGSSPSIGVIETEQDAGSQFLIAAGAEVGAGAGADQIDVALLLKGTTKRQSLYPATWLS